MRIEGVWRALKTTASSSDGTRVVPPFGGEHAAGSIVFESNGWMTTVLSDGRLANDLDAPRQFHAYAGTYEFNGHRIDVKVEVATDPNLVGSTQHRDVRFDGEVMILTPPPRNTDGRIITYEVYWSRAGA